MSGLPDKFKRLVFVFCDSTTSAQDFKMNQHITNGLVETGAGGLVGLNENPLVFESHTSMASLRTWASGLTHDVVLLNIAAPVEGYGDVPLMYYTHNQVDEECYVVTFVRDMVINGNDVPNGLVLVGNAHFGMDIRTLPFPDTQIRLTASQIWESEARHQEVRRQ